LVSWWLQKSIQRI